ncbi:MAG: hypothetical protein Tsb0016_10570 [Sphingomonadales bacterium]
MPRLDRAASIADLAALARRRLPGAIFDFIDGAAFDGHTNAANSADFAKLRFWPRVLRDVSHRSLATQLAGQAAAMPVAIAPTGVSGAVPGGGRGEAMAARAAAAAGVPFTLGMLAQSSIEEIAEQVTPPWFQLCMLQDRDLVQALVARAKAAACPVLVLTATWPYFSQQNRLFRNPHAAIPPRWAPGTLWHYGKRPLWALKTLFGRPIKLRNFEPHMPNGADLVQVVGQLDASTNWDDVAWLRDLWPGKLLVKGVMRPDEVAAARRVGVDAVSVSNHGGNQIDQACSTISVLPEIVAAAAGQVEVLLDGGVRSGQDVLKALALGASGCLIGRAHLYGLGAGGEAGVARALAIIRTELDITLGLVGLTGVGQAGPDILRPHPEFPITQTMKGPLQMAKKYKFVALVNAVDGKDDIFNDWHSGTHLPEVVRAAGFTRGERLKLVPGTNGENTAYQYLVVFEGEGDQPMEALQKLGAAVEAGQIQMSDSLGGPIWSSLYEEIDGAVYEA